MGHFAMKKGSYCDEKGPLFDGWGIVSVRFAAEKRGRELPELEFVL